MELNCNEGAQLYNAAIVAAHHRSYPEKAGWTVINYPILSYVLAA